MTGDVVGLPVAAENFFAFFLESTFLGVLLFGRDRVSKGVYYFSVWMVALGAVLSAIWIIVANSLQHTPAGFAISGGKMVITDFWAAIPRSRTRRGAGGRRAPLALPREVLLHPDA